MTDERRERVAAEDREFDQVIRRRDLALKVKRAEAIVRRLSSDMRALRAVAATFARCEAEWRRLEVGEVAELYAALRRNALKLITEAGPAFATATKQQRYVITNGRRTLRATK